MKEILDFELIHVGTYTLKVYNVVTFIVFTAFIVFLLAGVKRIIYRSKTLDVAKKFSFNKLFRYLITTLAAVIGLHILGFNVSVLLAGSAALLIGLGFGLQNLFHDFISGVILLLDKTLKVGDIIEVNEMIYKVLEINFRTTTVLGRDENFIIMPNSELTSNRVINWTYGNISARFRIKIGVDYSTDVPTLVKVAKEVALKNPKVLQKPEPFVRFEDYGDSALIFYIFFYTDEIFRVESTKSQIRYELHKAFHANNIHIPFPQRVVHMRNQ